MGTDPPVMTHGQKVRARRLHAASVCEQFRRLLEECLRKEGSIAAGLALDNERAAMNIVCGQIRSGQLPEASWEFMTWLPKPDRPLPPLPPPKVKKVAESKEREGASGYRQFKRENRYTEGHHSGETDS